MQSNKDVVAQQRLRTLLPSIVRFSVEAKKRFDEVFCNFNAWDEDEEYPLRGLQSGLLIPPIANFRLAVGYLRELGVGPDADELIRVADDYSAAVAAFHIAESKIKHGNSLHDEHPEYSITRSVFEAGIAIESVVSRLSLIINKVGGQLGPPTKEAKGGSSVNGSEDHNGSKKPESNKLPKSPTPRDWLVAHVRNLLKPATQRELVEKLHEYGVTTDQGSVSRSLSAVDKYVRAGGTPMLLEEAVKTVTVDPKVLDRGKRLDHRTPRQRESFAGDEK